MTSLEEVYNKLKNRILFEPHVVTFTSKSTEFISKNCVSNGAYCAFDPGHTTAATGRDVVIESIRQKCIYKVSIPDYFKYMKYFYEKCFESFDEKCSKWAVDKTWVDWTQVQKCVERSFHGSNKALYANDNELLADEKDKMKRLGTTNFPNIFINNILYKGSLSKYDILLSICSTLHDDVSDCQNIDMVPYDDFSFWTMALIQLAVFLIGSAVMAYLCRRVAKKQYLKDLNKAVDKYVTEYSSLKEEARA